LCVITALVHATSWWEERTRAARLCGTDFYSGAGPSRNQQIERISLMKYTTVKISEIAAHPTMRLDPGYWIKKKKKIRAKPQAASNKLKKSI